ncbi:MAG TPA: ribosomal protein S18-alanine N-acetyltransferase [Terriglobales bacterium]|nr:ribosomal protein S18-alanine N-acetyltransferase [Terriglobales bacterium]
MPEAGRLVITSTDGTGSVTGSITLQFAADEAEIHDLQVEPSHRRHGIGTALIRRALGAACERGARWIYLEVRESNAGARRLYRAQGFTECGRREAYYNAPVEAAILMRCPAADPNAGPR